MSDDLVINQVKILKKNAEMLLSEYVALKKKYQDLEQVHKEVTQKLISLENEVQEKNNVEPVIVNSAQTLALKSKLAEYIKEIDDCIALLATQE